MVSQTTILVISLACGAAALVAIIIIVGVYLWKRKQRKMKISDDKSLDTIESETSIDKEKKDDGPSKGKIIERTTFADTKEIDGTKVTDVSSNGESEADEQKQKAELAEKETYPSFVALFQVGNERSSKHEGSETHEVKQKADMADKETYPSFVALFQVGNERSSIQGNKNRNKKRSKSMKAKASRGDKSKKNEIEVKRNDTISFPVQPAEKIRRAVFRNDSLVNTFIDKSKTETADADNLFSYTKKEVTHPMPKMTLSRSPSRCWEDLSADLAELNNLEDTSESEDEDDKKAKLRNIGGTKTSDKHIDTSTSDNMSYVADTVYETHVPAKSRKKNNVDKNEDISSITSEESSETHLEQRTRTDAKNKVIMTNISTSNTSDLQSGSKQFKDRDSNIKEMNTPGTTQLQYDYAKSLSESNANTPNVVENFSTVNLEQDTGNAITTVKECDDQQTILGDRTASPLMRPKTPEPSRENEIKRLTNLNRCKSIPSNTRFNITKRIKTETQQNDEPNYTNGPFSVGRSTDSTQFNENDFVESLDKPYNVEMSSDARIKLVSTDELTSDSAELDQNAIFQDTGIKSAVVPTEFEKRSRHDMDLKKETYSDHDGKSAVTTEYFADDSDVKDKTPGTTHHQHANEFSKLNSLETAITEIENISFDRHPKLTTTVTDTKIKQESQSHIIPSVEYPSSLHAASRSRKRKHATTRAPTPIPTLDAKPKKSILKKLAERKRLLEVRIPCENEPFDESAESKEEDRTYDNLRDYPIPNENPTKREAGFIIEQTDRNKHDKSNKEVALSIKEDDRIPKENSGDSEKSAQQSVTKPDNKTVESHKGENNVNPTVFDTADTTDDSNNHTDDGQSIASFPLKDDTEGIKDYPFTEPEVHTLISSIDTIAAIPDPIEKVQLKPDDFRIERPAEQSYGDVMLANSTTQNDVLETWNIDLEQQDDKNYSVAKVVKNITKLAPGENSGYQSERNLQILSTQDGSPMTSHALGTDSEQGRDVKEDLKVPNNKQLTVMDNAADSLQTKFKMFDRTDIPHLGQNTISADIQLGTGSLLSKGPVTTDDSTKIDHSIFESNTTALSSEFGQTEGARPDVTSLSYTTDGNKHIEQKKRKKPKKQRSKSLYGTSDTRFAQTSVVTGENRHVLAALGNTDNSLAEDNGKSPDLSVSETFQFSRERKAVALKSDRETVSKQTTENNQEPYGSTKPESSIKGSSEVSIIEDIEETSSEKDLHGNNEATTADHNNKQFEHIVRDTESNLPEQAKTSKLQDSAIGEGSGGIQFTFNNDSGGIELKVHDQIDTFSGLNVERTSDTEPRNMHSHDQEQVKIDVRNKVTNSKEEKMYSSTNVNSISTDMGGKPNDRLADTVSKSYKSGHNGNPNTLENEKYLNRFVPKTNDNGNTDILNTTHRASSSNDLKNNTVASFSKHFADERESSRGSVSELRGKHVTRRKTIHGSSFDTAQSAMPSMLPSLQKGLREAERFKQFHTSTPREGDITTNETFHKTMADANMPFNDTSRARSPPFSFGSGLKRNQTFSPERSRNRFQNSRTVNQENDVSRRSLERSITVKSNVSSTNSLQASSQTFPPNIGLKRNETFHDASRSQARNQRTSATRSKSLNRRQDFVQTVNDRDLNGQLNGPMGEKQNKKKGVSNNVQLKADENKFETATIVSTSDTRKTTELGRNGGKEGMITQQPGTDLKDAVLYSDTRSVQQRPSSSYGRTRPKSFRDTPEKPVLRRPTTAADLITTQRTGLRRSKDKNNRLALDDTLSDASQISDDIQELEPLDKAKTHQDTINIQVKGLGRSKSTSLQYGTIDKSIGRNLSGNGETSTKSSKVTKHETKTDALSEVKKIVKKFHPIENDLISRQGNTTTERMYSNHRSSTPVFNYNGQADAKLGDTQKTSNLTKNKSLSITERIKETLTSTFPTPQRSEIPKASYSHEKGYQNHGQSNRNYRGQFHQDHRETTRDNAFVKFPTTKPSTNISRSKTIGLGDRYQAAHKQTSHVERSKTTSIEAGGHLQYRYDVKSMLQTAEILKSKNRYSHHMRSRTIYDT